MANINANYILIPCLFIIPIIGLGLIAYGLSLPGYGKYKPCLNDTQKISIEILFESLSIIGTLSIAIIGAFWGFVVNKIEIKVFNKSSIKISIIGTFILALSWLAYILNSIYLFEAMYKGVSIPIGTAKFNYWLYSQIICFAIGVLLLSTVIIRLAHNKAEV
jgi:hypothetical protein